MHIRSTGAGLLFCGAYLASSAACGGSAEVFGRAGERDVDIFTLTNRHGIEARIMTYGATIVSLKTPDRYGQLKNIVLGFDNLDSYLAGVPYYGATVGRYANRIAKGHFTLDGTSYKLPLNDGPNSLHGGTQGFDKRIWTAMESGAQGPGTLRLTYISAAGEEGYPGQLTAVVTYRLTEDDALEISYEATTTAPTPVNIANHSYFNLTGDPTQTILGHQLQINAAAFTPVDATLIPTGEQLPVAGTPFDFNHATSIGSRIDDSDEQLKRGHGYDHNWVLKPTDGSKGTLRFAATLTDPDSGRVLEMRTTQPGLQFYSGNFMDGKPSKRGTVYAFRTGLCLETQHFPDSPNHPAFPNTILRPGEKYAEKTLLHFRTSREPAR
jgi:aldose 1-epimerase